MTATATDLAFVPFARKWQHFDSVQAYETHVAEGGGKAQGIVELLAGPGRHGNGRVEQQANRYAGLDLKHLEEHLVEPHVGAPVDGAQVVALMEVAMIEKLLAAAREMRPVVSSDQPGEGTLPSNRKAFEAFEEAPVEKRFFRQTTPRLSGGSAHFNIGKNRSEDRIRRLPVGVSVEIQNNAVTEH